MIIEWSVGVDVSISITTVTCIEFKCHTRREWLCEGACNNKLKKSLGEVCYWGECHTEDWKAFASRRGVTSESLCVVTE